MAKVTNFSVVQGLYAKYGAAEKDKILDEAEKQLGVKRSTLTTYFYMAKKQAGDVAPRKPRKSKAVAKKSKAKAKATPAKEEVVAEAGEAEPTAADLAAVEAEAIPEFMVDIDDYSSEVMVAITVTNLNTGKSAYSSCGSVFDADRVVEDLKERLTGRG